MAEHADKPGYPGTPDFDGPYWEKHWREAPGSEPGAGDAVGPNPHLIRETSGLTPGKALDAGCGEGREAGWLASCGWEVTAVDISSEALAHAAGQEFATNVEWVQADLTSWPPDTEFDLVVTHYAHPSMPQLAFYGRISHWVRPGGTLLIVGHRHTAGSTGHGHRPPAEASVTCADITAVLDTATWTIVTAEEHVRTLTASAGRAVPLHDIVVRATRRH